MSEPLAIQVARIEEKIDSYNREILEKLASSEKRVTKLEDTAQEHQNEIVTLKSDKRWIGILLGAFSSSLGLALGFMLHAGIHFL